MQRFRSLLYLLLGVSSPLIILAKAEVSTEYTDVLVARDFEYFGMFPGRVAPLSKRQSPQDVCGVNYMLCDTTHCCEEGTYCELRTLGWYCPVIGGSSSVAPTPTMTSLDFPSPTPDEPTTTPIIDTAGTDSPSVTYFDEPSQTSDSAIPTDGTVQDVTVNTKKKGGFGTGAMIGIIVAVIVILIIAAVAAFFVIRSKKKKQKEVAGPPMQSNPQQQYTAPPLPQGYVQPQQQYGMPPPEGYYSPQGQYLQAQYPQYPQGQYPQAPPSPAPQYNQSYPQYGSTAPPIVDDTVKDPTPGAGYYQPGHNGAVEAMSQPTSPGPTPAPQVQAQAPPPSKPGIHEM